MIFRKPIVSRSDASIPRTAKRVDALATAGLSGFVLKADSPSCGPTGVRMVVDGSVTDVRAGVGPFARALLARFPDLPIVDERQLADEKAREAFLARVFAYRASNA